MKIQLTLRVLSQSQTRGWRNLRIRSRVRLGKSRLGNTFDKKSMRIQLTLRVRSQSQTRDGETQGFGLGLG